MTYHKNSCQKLTMKNHSPKQTPVPIIGGFVIHLSGNSQVPENPPGPPHASPSIFAHTLQHLDEKQDTKMMKINSYVYYVNSTFHFFFLCNFILAFLLFP